MQIKFLKKFKKIISQVVIKNTADYWEEVLNRYHVPTSKTDINLENTLSEILDDKLFEDLDILGPEVKDLVGTNPKIGKA